MKTPKTAGLYWVRYMNEKKRRLVVVTGTWGKGLDAEIEGAKLPAISGYFFSNWTRAGRPPTKSAGSKATTQIQLRVSPRRKKAYQKAARRNIWKCSNLTTWILRVCDAAAGFSD